MREYRVRYICPSFPTEFPDTRTDLDRTIDRRTAGPERAGDSVDAPTYLDYRMPSDRRDEVRRLGACWDAVRSRYYVPAGVGLVAFEGWRERPPMS